MKLATIVGARPQFIKAAMVSRAIRLYNESCKSDPFVEEILVHTGQHYDYEMSQVFFDQLELPRPHIHLGIGSGSHGDQTGKMLSAIEKAMLKDRPDIVLVYGDTNSTLAGALAAVKLHIPVAHVEAGMRSFNRKMPEEVNRVVTDHLAKWHFCCTQTAVNNLKDEGICNEVCLVGDVMYEAHRAYEEIAGKLSKVLCKLELISSNGDTVPYGLVTIHRAENTDDPKRLKEILLALSHISEEMVLVMPLHPRTKKALKQYNYFDEVVAITEKGRIKIIEALSYLDMICVESSAQMIITDSGGVQKEAYWLGVPCITIRDETEWVETIANGDNRLAKANKKSILDAFVIQMRHGKRKGDAEKASSASEKIVRILAQPTQ